MTSKPKFMSVGLMALGVLLLTSSAAKADIGSVAIDTNAHLTSNGTIAIVTGAVLCAAGDTLDVQANVIQLKGKVQVSGVGSEASTTCTGVPQAFAVQVQVVIPPNESYKKGPASVLLFVSTSNSVPDFDSQTVTAKVHLSQ